MKDILPVMSDGEMIEYLARENENLAHVISSAKGAIQVCDELLLSTADHLSCPHPLTEPKTK